MPRAAKGARLWLRPARYDQQGRLTHEAVYLIRDGNRQQSTGCGPHEHAKAERALRAYLETKHQPTGSSNPAEVEIADVLDLYQTKKAPHVKRPDMLFCTIRPLLIFWDKKTVAQIKGATCDDYIAWRFGQKLLHGKKTTRTVGMETVRRELETLRAAVRLYHAKHTLTVVPVVSVPKPGPAREGWLTRSEVARLLWAAWREPKAKHLVRFILIGVYTGTRHKAILDLTWKPTGKGGYIDLGQTILYRKAEREVETKKRKPPIRIPRRLLAHIRRWSRMDAERGINVVVHYEDGPIQKERRAWATACRRAGLGTHVIPHMMRHTCATWLMQAGVKQWEAAGYLGMTPQMLDAVYAHHNPSHQAEVNEAF